MTAANDDHRVQWTPPPRPAWVSRINEEGRWMDISGVVPLDERSLLETAMRNTGLSDFGDDGWREPFQIFIKSLEEEADLNLMGRLYSRSEALQLLESRLQIEDIYKRHPEINDEEIKQPIIVVGQGRSGTSFLVNVLSANPENGTPKYWEVAYPSPPPETATYKTDPRIEKAHKFHTLCTRIVPELASMHEFSGNLPFECMQLMALNFMAPTFLDVLGQVPSYDAYFYQQDIVPTLRYHQRVLKLLQWKNPRKHWVLKDVMHLDRMPQLLQVYPDACFVWPHRDPVRALASTVNIIGSIQWVRNDHPFKAASWAYVTDPQLGADRLGAAIDLLDSGEIPTKQVHHLRYKDLVSDPIRTLEKMYQHFGMPLTDDGRQGMTQYLAENPRDSRPPHKFKMGSDDVVARARHAFARYQARFDVPSE